MNFPAVRAAHLFSLFFLISTCIGSSVRGQEIPDDLLEDEHVREEFGVNKFTTPSIRKIFNDLKALRPLPYEELKRTMPEKTPSDRTKLALTVGFLLADGFFAVEAEQFYDMEPIGRALLKHSKVLGAGTKVSRHTKSLLEHGATNDWTGLKDELARTQKDVEKEMVLIRDVDAANLISLGGWLRAFEIGCAASLNPYDPEKAKLLERPDIVEYFSLNLETLDPRIKKNQVVAEVIIGLKKVQEMVTVPKQEVLREEDVVKLQALVEKLVDQAYGAPLVSHTKAGREKAAAVAATGDKKPGVPAVRAKKATGGVVTGEVKEKTAEKKTGE